MTKTAVVVILLVAALVIGAAGYFGFATTKEPESTPAPQTISVTTCDVEQSVAAPGNLVNVGLENINMPATGKLSEVYVRTGDVVKKGQTLADMDAVAKSEAQLKLIEAKEVFEKEQKERTSLDYPRASADYIKQQKNKVKLLKAKLSFKTDAYNETTDPAAKAQLLDEIAAVQTELLSEEAALKWLMSKPSEADFAQADTELSLAEANFEAAKALLKSLSIVAPFGGVVLESKAQTGVTINVDTILFKVGDPKELEVQANITEEDFPIVSVGQEVEIFFDARPELTIQGKVSRIIPQRIEGEDSPLYDIYITLDDVPDGLADGMTADTAITIAKSEGVLCLPRAVVRASGGDTTIVKVWDGVQELEKEITIGLRGDTYVEIVSGLEEGEQVVTR
ncbi:MAG: efflux RND transporter periplasmic adaptor subunit [Chloroflexi bacterium]|nr:efflux RND transporter periplasmic adaptor subunit [Chloroflexota bacterium]